MRQWFYMQNDQQQGPVPQALLEEMLKKGELPGQTLVWYEGMSDWKQAQEMPELIKPSSSTSPQTRTPVIVQRLSRGNRFFFSRVFPLLFLGTGLLMLVLGVIQVARAFESSGWPSVAGKVVSSRVETTRITRDGRTTYTHHAKVSYKYSVDGVTYNGDRVAFGDYGSSDPDHTSGIVDRYKPNSEVSVYYAPSDPGLSVLDMGL